ncbi:MAG: type II secretion system protein [Limisphaerales bacterium]
MTSKNLKAGFTLIEMLTVIAIIGILAALVTGVGVRAANGRKISRVQADLNNLESVIERYQNDLHFYPPSGERPELPPLYYELTGMRFQEPNQYIPLSGGAPVNPSIFGIGGFANSNPETAKNYFSNLKPNQFSRTTEGVDVLTVPVEGPATPAVVEQGSNKQLNTWRYVSNNPTNNPNSFDLWAEIIVGGKTNIIGNWKE